MIDRVSGVLAIVVLAVAVLIGGNVVGAGVEATPVLFDASPVVSAGSDRIAFATRQFHHAVDTGSISFSVSVHRTTASAQLDFERFAPPASDDDGSDLVTISFPIIRDGSTALFASAGNAPDRLELVIVAVRDGRFVFSVSVIGSDVLDTVLPLLDILPSEPETLVGDDPRSAVLLLPGLDTLPIGFYLVDEQVLTGRALPENAPTPTETPVPTATATTTPSPTADVPATATALVAFATAATGDLATADAESAAAQATITAYEERQATSDDNLATAQARVNIVQTTVATLEEQQSAAEATVIVLAETAANSALDPNLIDLSIQVSLNGILGGDDDARDDALEQLDEILEPFRNCRVGFVLISGYAGSIGQGNQLAEAIFAMLQDEYPELFADAGAETFANLSGNSGQVDMSLLVYQGCNVGP